MSVEWKELFNGKASVYILNNESKEWSERGEKGTIYLYFDASNKNNISMQWTKPTAQALNWRLMGSKLKPKGDRAYILKAISNEDGTHEIIAVRFPTVSESTQFSKIYLSLQDNAPVNISNNNKWICNACTFGNDISNTICQICTAPKQHSETLPPIQISIPINAPLNNTNKWTCRMCSYNLNDYSSPNCTMCGLINNALTTQTNDNQDASTWICAVCTYTNDTDAPACAMCGLGVIESAYNNQPPVQTTIQVFNYSNNIQPENEIQEGQGHTIFSKEELYSFSSVHIASLLVPQPKIYKNQYKQWMNILLNANEGPLRHKIISYIYKSAANTKGLYNYIAIPDEFTHTILLQKDKNVASYIKEPRLQYLPSQYKIIVYGYIRKVKQTYIPKVIIELIFGFYIAVIKIFLFQLNQQITEFDISNQQTNIVMKKGKHVSRFISHGCKICIPDLTSEDLKMPNVELKGEYYGILSYTNFVLCSKTSDDMFSFSCGDKYINMSGPEEQIDHVYCGTQHGIIISDLDSIYQLQLKNIQDNWDVKRLCYKYGFPGHAYHGTSSTCYMKGMNKLFVVQIENNNGISKAGFWDFIVKTWSTVPQTVGHHIIGTEAFCDTMFNYNDRSSIYLLTNDLQLSQYDINKNAWTELFEGDVNCAHVYEKKPILWLDNDNVLYSAMLHRDETVNGYNIVVQYFDARAKYKTWKPHFLDWNDLIAHNADCSEAQLFKWCS